MLAFILIIAGILFRFVPHAPNFTPVAAIALFAGAYLNKKYAVLVPLLLMAASDAVMGLHDVVLFTWAGFIISGLIGMMLKNSKNPARIIGASLASSVVFYIISNFGVWIMGWYPRDLQGLVNCYVMALPFLRNFTLSTLVYSVLFFSIYEFIASRVKETKFSRILLTS